MYGAYNVSSGSTKTLTNVATDGTHIWITAGGAKVAKKVSYNGDSVVFSYNNEGWMITIPDNFDNTIPFVFYTS